MGKTNKENEKRKREREIRENDTKIERKSRKT